MGKLTRRDFGRWGLGIATSLGFGGLVAVCSGQSDDSNNNNRSDDDDNNSGDDDSPLENIVEGRTDRDGYAFSGDERIQVTDANGNPLSNTAVNLYHLESGDAYIAKNRNEEGGLAVFPGTPARDHEERKLIIEPNQGVTSFDRNSPEAGVVHDLFRLTTDRNRLYCDGWFMGNQLDDYREDTATIIAYFDPTGSVLDVAVNLVKRAIADGLADYDFRPEEKYVALRRGNPTGHPFFISDEVARWTFPSRTYADLNDPDNCTDYTVSDNDNEGQPCADGDVCTLNDRIINGNCVGEEVDCTETRECLVGYCDVTEEGFPGCYTDEIPDCEP